MIYDREPLSDRPRHDESAGREYKLEDIPEVGRRLEEILSAEEIDDRKLAEIVFEWRKICGETGYQHNFVLLADHVKEVIRAIKGMPEFNELGDKEKHLALISSLFHDIGKPTGKLGTAPRDFGHEKPSAEIAERYTKQWGYKRSGIQKKI